MDGISGQGSLLGFVAAALVVLLLPGPAVLYVVARAASQGRRAGLVSALGLSAGALFHVAAATAGLSAVLLTSASAFGAVKLLGAGYLIFLGIRSLRSGDPDAGAVAGARRGPHRLFLDGAVVSVFNPKIAIFFLAFLPQFVDRSRGAVPQQLLSLGLLYVALALCTDSAYAILASRVRESLEGRLFRGALPRYASGAVYIGLGVSAAFAERE